MLTHEIIVTKPTKPRRTTAVTGGKLDKRRRNRLQQDLKCKQIKEGDTVYIEQYGYGQVMEIVADYEQISDWDGTAPLNILVWVYDDQTEYFFNVFSLHKA